MTKTTTPADAFAAARDAFSAAVLAGSTAIDEYQAWQAAHADVLAEHSKRLSAARDELERLHAEHRHLMSEAKILPELARRAGTQVGSVDGSRFYSHAEHEARVADWLERATRYAGTQVDTVSQLALQLPTEPFVAAPPAAPPAYTAAVDRVLSDAARTHTQEDKS